MFVCAILARFSANCRGNCRLSHEVFTEIQLVLCGFQIGCFTPVLRASTKVRGFDQANKVVPLILLNPISEIKTGKSRLENIRLTRAIPFIQKLVDRYTDKRNSKTWNCYYTAESVCVCFLVRSTYMCLLARRE